MRTVHYRALQQPGLCYLRGGIKGDGQVEQVVQIDGEVPIVPDFVLWFDAQGAVIPYNFAAAIAKRPDRP